MELIKYSFAMKSSVCFRCIYFKSFGLFQFLQTVVYAKANKKIKRTEQKRHVFCYRKKRAPFVRRLFWRY